MPGGRPANSSGARPLRVLHFVSTFAVKTDTKLLARMVPHVNRSRVDWSIACFYGDGPMRRKFAAAGCQTFNLDVPGECDLRAIYRAARLIQRIQPDVVHTHLLRADLMAGIAARLMDVPVIVGAAYAIGDFRRERRRLSDGLIDAVCGRLPSHFLAVSRATKADWQARLGLNENDISVIHTGIESAPTIDAKKVAAFRSSCGASDGSPLIVTVGRLSYEKGMDTLIDTANALHRSRTPFHWAVVGDGSDRAAIQQRIDKLGLAKSVRLVGFQIDTWPAIAAADVFCIPSKMEAFPVVMLEAMAAGRPILATRVGGIREAITNGRNGLLVEPQAKPMADALQRLLHVPSLRTRLGLAAQQTARERFDVRRVASSYTEFYESLADRKGVAHAHATPS